MVPASTEESPLSGKRIIIAGAGMAGLSFSLALHKHSTTKYPTLPPPIVTIYDRDTRAASIGREGYSLSIVGDTADGGLYTLSQLGLLDETLKHALIGGDGSGPFKIWTERWQELISVKLKPFGHLPTGAIRIARKDLRSTLLNAASEKGVEIRWGLSCTSVTKLEGGRARVRILNHGTEEESDKECDLLVAADGSSSKLRAQLRPQDGLNYAGAVQMGGVARYDKGLPSPIDVNWGGVLTGRGVFVFLSPVSKKEVVWALSICEDAPRPKFDNHDPAQVAAMLVEAKELSKNIGEPWPEVVKRTVPETTFMIPARDKKPFNNHAYVHEWGPAVFIGDANHAVSPFGGNGANLALRDGWDLANCLCQGNGLEQGVKEYDKLSGPRASATLRSSHQRIAMGHSTGIWYWVSHSLFTLGGFALKVLGRS
ncbi:hypothetical protein SCAR479_12932 [Seiridium cardinale]|uniref:FAD-binding domain-containing protein n=1 Tax=Seiridium cardinale TaxID=138064 RepID=A0ABR2X9A8_9PEZI